MNIPFTGQAQLYFDHPEFESTTQPVSFTAEFEDGDWAIRPSGFTPIRPEATVEVVVTLATVAEGQFAPASGRLSLGCTFKVRAVVPEWRLPLQLTTDTAPLGLSSAAPGSGPTVAGSPMDAQGRFALAGRGRLVGPALPAGISGTEVLLELSGSFSPRPAG